MYVPAIIFLPVLFSGVISGMIIFHASIIAPSLFKTVSAKESVLFLRMVFPKLFLFVLILGVFSLVISFFSNESIVVKIVSVTTIVSMVICYLIIPATNSAKDSGNGNTFKRLHGLSFIFTMIVLLLNLFWIFLI